MCSQLDTARDVIPVAIRNCTNSRQIYQNKRTRYSRIYGKRRRKLDMLDGLSPHISLHFSHSQPTKRCQLCTVVQYFINIACGTTTATMTTTTATDTSGKKNVRKTWTSRASMTTFEYTHHAHTPNCIFKLINIVVIGDVMTMEEYSCMSEYGEMNCAKTWSNCHRRRGRTCTTMQLQMVLPLWRCWNFCNQPI